MGRLYSSLGFVFLFVFTSGCSKPEKRDLAKTIIADKNLSDQEAVDKLGELFFEKNESLTTKVLKTGGIHLTVVLHPKKTSQTSKIEGQSSGQFHQFSVLFTPLLESSSLIQNGSQRGLEKLTVRIKDTALNPNNQEEDFDLFGFTVDKPKFEQFRAQTQFNNIARGDAREKIRPVVTIDIDNFDQLTFSRKH